MTKKDGTEQSGYYIKPVFHGIELFRINIERIQLKIKRPNLKKYVSEELPTLF